MQVTGRRAGLQARATTKLYKLSTHHPRLEVRYWTGKYWEPLYGARFHEVLNALDLTPNA